MRISPDESASLPGSVVCCSIPGKAAAMASEALASLKLPGNNSVTGYLLTWRSI
jgi:hypothetical protein